MQTRIFERSQKNGRAHRRRTWTWAPLACLLSLVLYGCNGPSTQTGFPEPENIISQNGALETDLYVQFAKAKVGGATTNTGQPVAEIWTRAYGTQPANPDNLFIKIPGPTLVYHPGDWLQITLHNQLNRSANPWLNDFQDNVPDNSQDDIEELVPSEVNIPHNANNTNLHVHGMHVDPKDDNVTLLILPEDDDPSNYTPELQRLMPDIDRWWEWEYGYRVPADHLPGTHWYHAHKHGATSTHVENGMAGTLLVRPNNDADAIVPGLWNDDPSRSHDRVMVLQEIANYGIQQGAGRGITTTREAIKTDRFTTDWPDITVNGQHQPTLALAPGQTERWRFVDAGANHRTASYLWIGQLIPPDAIPDTLRSELEAITNFETASPYLNINNTTSFTGKFFVEIRPFPGSVKLVALDGITLHEAIDITPEKPVLVGPGNRADVFIQPDADASGTYFLGKNFNVAPTQAELAKHPVYGDLFAGEAGYWRYTAITSPAGNTVVINVDSTGSPATYAPYTNLSLDPYALGTNFQSFQRPWPVGVTLNGALDPTKTNTTTGSTTQATPLAPLIKGRAAGVGVDAVPISGSGFTFPGVGWTISGGGPPSLVDSQAIITLNVAGPAVTTSPAPPTNDRLNRLSPTTTEPDNTLLVKTDADGNLIQGIPSYVAPINDSDIAGRQVIVFDRSGVVFNYIPPDGSQQNPIQQFSLNGRQFDLNDFVGNPAATALIQTPVPPYVENPYSSTDSLLGTYQYNGAGNYSNLVQVGGTPTAFFTNPGYFAPVVRQGTYFTYNYSVSAAPTYQTITGLATPRQPEATTAEEWLLVNNSRIFHPFHIHISPFLVTEVGQMNYDGTSWSIRTLSPGDSMGYVLNNWWDTIIIPPQGYVKIRLWMNIPDQKPTNPDDPNSGFSITENANVFGAWVYHCHILRHEDRGMMMVVSVKPKPVPTPN